MNKSGLKDKSVIVTLLIFLLIIVLLSNRLGMHSSDHSISNRSDEGYSIFYELLKRYNYPVHRALEPISNYGVDNIQIVTGYDYITSDKGAERWIKKGGVLVLLDPRNDLEVSVEAKGTGFIIRSSPEAISNSSLLRETDHAYQLLEELENHDYEKVYFNEKNLFSTTTSKTLWSIIPIEIKVILYQILFVVLALLYYKGKRFGKVKTFHEESEREENEYIYSVASLYKRAKCWDLLVEYYYNNLLKEVNSNSNNFLDYWERKNLSSLDSARKLHKFMGELEGRPKEKEALQIITIIEELEEIIKKRRDKYWKKLKRDT